MVVEFGFPTGRLGCRGLERIFAEPSQRHAACCRAAFASVCARVHRVGVQRHAACCRAAFASVCARVHHVGVGRGLHFAVWPIVGSLSMFSRLRASVCFITIASSRDAPSRGCVNLLSEMRNCGNL